jgi:Uma2 family endonuclease
MASVPTIQTQLDPLVVPEVPVKRWTVAEYHELIRLGVLQEGDPYELIEGWLVTKMTKNPPHESAVSYLSDVFVKSLPQNWRCRTQCAITLPDGEPEPDLAIVKGPQSRYRSQHPTPEDIAIVIEVSDATLAQDQGVKLRTYARAGIAEYWIVNLIDQQIEVYTQPRIEQNLPRYATKQVYSQGKLVSLVVDAVEIARVSASEACNCK